MNFDPELAPFAGVFPVLDLNQVTESRTIATAMLHSMMGPDPTVWPGGITAEDHTVTGPDGTGVPVRVLYPPDRSASMPALLYLHGGAFVLGDFEGDSHSAARYCVPVGAVVVHVGYRLAPEHRFPAAFIDSYAALEWVVDSASELGIDPARLAVVGASAGGGLAAGVCLRARDVGGPAITCQLLNYPVLDDRLSTVSSTGFASTPGWNSPNRAVMWKHSAPAGSSEYDDYMAPARAADLSGLPRTYLLACEFDPLRDEGIAYGQRLLASGVPTELHAFPGTFHGFDGLPAGISQRAWGEQIAFLRSALGVTG